MSPHTPEHAFKLLAELKQLESLPIGNETGRRLELVSTTVSDRVSYNDKIRLVNLARGDEM